MHIQDRTDGAAPSDKSADHPELGVERQGFKFRPSFPFYAIGGVRKRENYFLPLNTDFLFSEGCSFTSCCFFKSRIIPASTNRHYFLLSSIPAPRINHEMEDGPYEDVLQQKTTTPRKSSLSHLIEQKRKINVARSYLHWK